jgi:tripartite-type tricarboxylate transporter receptor subunit TctC
MPKDGLNILMPADPLVVQQLMRPNKVKYDARRFTWLGATNQTNTVLVARTSSGITSLSDLKRQQLVVGSVGPGSTSYVFPKLAKETLGLKMKIISGYKGSSKTILAVEQGETQAAAFNWLAWSSKVPHWFTKGEAKALLQIGIWKDPDLPDVPMLSDLVAAEYKPIVAFIATHGIVGRGLAMPPGVSRDKIAILKSAFAKTVKDPSYVMAAKKRRLRVIASNGEDIQKAVEDAFANADEAVVARARALVFGKK